MTTQRDDHMWNRSRKVLLYDEENHADVRDQETDECRPFYPQTFGETDSETQDCDCPNLKKNEQDGHDQPICIEKTRFE